MAIKSPAHEAAREGPQTAPPVFKLILSPAPRAMIKRFLTIMCTVHNGCLVEKYSTRFGSMYEKHVTENGVATWWKLTAPGFVYDWKSGAWVKV